MKRRSFVQLLFALAGLPFLPKAAAKPSLFNNNPHDPFCGAGISAFPVGYIPPPYSGPLPKGYLPCDGRMASRLEFNSLYQAIGTSFGEGDGLTTFGLPDLRARGPYGMVDPGHRHGYEIFGEYIIKAKS